MDFVHFKDSCTFKPKMWTFGNMCPCCSCSHNLRERMRKLRNMLIRIINPILIWTSSLKQPHLHITHPSIYLLCKFRPYWIINIFNMHRSPKISVRSQATWPELFGINRTPQFDLEQSEIKSDHYQIASFQSNLFIQ